ncbi:MAG: AbrB/MazE/SpoVT family DNA-binding domain-containing protein [Nitrospinae bacterium]|nr:AbrB/MazE/SpoVT family DNA-binding domain-containing protein [Nitrospinota bacterium]
MKAVKVLPKGQITLPSAIRRRLKIKEGDTLVMEDKGEAVTIRKGKTIFDYAGSLPSLGMSIEAMREKAVKDSAHERKKSDN